MKVAIDIDGTLTKDPKRLGALIGIMSASANWHVVLLTGQTGDGTLGYKDESSRRAQVESLLPDGPTVPIVICWGKDTKEVAYRKGAYCRAHAIDLFIDNDTSYCQQVREQSPDTLVLQVL